MKRRCLSILLVLCMVMALLPTTAWAADSDFTIDENGVLTKYNGAGGDVTIPDGVTSIGYGAFLSCEQLQHVTIPNSVTSIGWNAFWMCTALEEIIIPDSVTSIGPQAFSDCSSATSLYLGKSLTTVERYAFSNLDSLETINYNAKNATGIESTAFSLNENNTGIDVTFGEAVEVIPAHLFSGSLVVKSAIIGKNVNEIKEYAFYESQLTTIEIPDNVSIIGEKAFSTCKELNCVKIGTGISTIGLDAFHGCSALEKIEFNAISMQDVEAYNTGWGESGVFRASGKTNGLTIIVTDSVERIPANIFTALNIKDLKLGNNIKSIGHGAFASTSLKYVEIPSSVTTIDSYAFARCSQLNAVGIGENVAFIGENAFIYSNVTDVYYNSGKTEWSLIDGDGKPSGETVTIHYNSTGPDDVGPDNMNPVYFLSGWDATTRTAQFGDDEITPYTYTVADSVDVSNISSLLNKYVLVTMEQGNSSLEYTITDIQPVESRIGTVSATGEHSLTIDGTTYPVREDYLLGTHDGQEFLYHVSDGTIMGFDVLEEKTGTLEVWDSATGKITIDSKVYPTNYMSDLSFQSDIDQHLGKKITFFTSGNSNYTPLIRIDKFIEPESEIAVFSTEKSLSGWGLARFLTLKLLEIGNGWELL